MVGTRTWLLRGLVAGAAGTTALDLTTYLDMAVLGRPASDAPKRTVEQLTERLHVPLPGDDRAHDARAVGLGTVLGHSVGLAIGLVAGGLRSAGWPRTRGGRIS